ncbi:MarR family transcriptional regulator [Oscillospiraceae bacterium 50-16]
MSEYDSLPHHYGGVVLYQAEAYIVNLVGQHPGITVTQLAEILKKTTSACSQIVRKLRAKGFVEQIRNPDNNRLYNLELTQTGAEVFLAHISFNQECQVKTFELLKDFTDEELMVHLRVQRKLNEAYQDDVKRSKEQVDRP